MTLPDFIIVGETKCGTTSMYDNLIQHPQIKQTLGNGDKLKVDATVPLGVKEIRFFDRYYQKGWDWYKSCFPLKTDSESFITGEATPTYLFRLNALSRMNLSCFSPKIIVMFREPVSRLVSHYHHLGKIHSDWYEKYPSISYFWDHVTDQDYHLIERGVYWKSVMNLLMYFETKDLHFIISEELFSDPDKIFKQTFEFLGVDTEVKIKANHSRKNTYKKEYIPSELKDFYKLHNKKLEKMLERELWK